MRVRRLAVRKECHLAGQSDCESHHSNGLQRGSSLRPCASRQAHCRSRTDGARSRASSGCSTPNLPKKHDCHFHHQRSDADCTSGLRAIHSISRNVYMSSSAPVMPFKRRGPQQDAVQQMNIVCPWQSTSSMGRDVMPHPLEGEESMRHRPHAHSTAP